MGGFRVQKPVERVHTLGNILAVIGCNPMGMNLESCNHHSVCKKQKEKILFYSITTGFFFLTSAAKKTKTQAQNSSQKLKKKTQPQGGSFLPSRKTQGKNSILRIFLKKLKGSDL